MIDRDVWSDKALYDSLRDSEKWRSYPGDYDSDDYDPVPLCGITSGSSGSTGEKQPRKSLRKKLSELVVRHLSDKQTYLVSRDTYFVADHVRLTSCTCSSTL